MNKFRVIIVGAGMSGICAAVKLLDAGITSFRILEKADGVGGTWRDNTYPGAACDVPSHLYSFSFAPKHDWSRMYAPGGEICSYLEECVKKFAIGAYLQFGTEVDRIEFIDNRWSLTTSDGEAFQADFVISAVGGLYTPHFPKFPGRDIFQGDQFHSSRWKHECDLTGRSVAVIGTGASAVQLIPEIASIAKDLHVFQRTPIWVLPKEDPLYTDEEKTNFREHAEAARAHRQEIWQEWEEFSVEVVRDTDRNRYLQDLATNAIRKAVDDPDTVQKLTPQYRYGCKRPTLSNTYYQTFNRENVHLVCDPIGSIEPDGVRTQDGDLYRVDAIIYATGFQPFDITTEIDVVGLDGLHLKDAWKDRIVAYRSVMVSNFPNFFTLLGPNSAGLTSALEMIEAQSKFAVAFIKYLEDKKIHHMHPTPEAQLEWSQLIIEGISGTIMNDGCHSWWTDNNGYSHVVWPYSSVDFREQLQSINKEEFIAS